MNNRRWGGREIHFNDSSGRGNDIESESLARLE